MKHPYKTLIAPSVSVVRFDAADIIVTSPTQEERGTVTFGVRVDNSEPVDIIF